MTFLKTFRSAASWRGIGAVALISGIVIVASIGLVSFRNRHRDATQAIQWAVDRLDRIPEDTVMRVYTPAVFYEAVGEFHRAIRDNVVPVDSVRHFYQEYALRARDGHFTASEVAELGPYLGLPQRTIVPTPADTTSTPPDSISPPAGE
jgi:hypothetical protein